MDHLLQVRLEKSCEKLVQTNLSIQEIASSVGFTSTFSNFNRQFKQHYHLTPRQYRNPTTWKENMILSP